MNFPKASIVVATINNSITLKKTLNAMNSLSYPAKYEIIVVNDGSTDNTKEMLEKEFEGKEKFKIVNLPHVGACKARNTGIRKAKGEIIVIMDHDCIPKKNWLKDLIKGFDSDKVGMVSSFDIGGGTSTAFRRTALKKTGLFDEKYYYYREDTDLVFRIIEAGYKAKEVKAEYIHDHKLVKPEGIINLARHAFQRVMYHHNDVLLYKKHPELAKEFLGVKFGFIVNPSKDFRAATGTWASGVSYSLSSPRGITYIKNKSPLHSIIIFLLGAIYVIAVKAARLYGSIKFGKLLV